MAIIIIYKFISLFMRQNPQGYTLKWSDEPRSLMATQFIMKNQEALLRACRCEPGGDAEYSRDELPKRYSGERGVDITNSVWSLPYDGPDRASAEMIP